MPTLPNSTPVTSAQLTLFAEGLLVKTSPSPDPVRDWLAQSPDCSLTSFASVMHFLMRGSFGKTFRVCSPRVLAKTSPRSSPNSPDTILPFPANGKPKASVSDPNVPSLGLCWTRSGSAWRKGAVACSLSAILEIGPVPTKYYLSPKACAGILRRAEKRGRSLPPSLHQALAQGAQAMSAPKPTSS